MTSFIIGKVVEPEVRGIKVKGADRQICALGILSGRTCTNFDVWDEDKTFARVSNLEDGDMVIAIIGVSVDGQGKLRTYLNGIGDCPDGLREQLMDLVKK